MTITKELVYSLNDDDITVKKQIEILNLINKKVDEIWKYIIASSERSLNWYDYSNSYSGSDVGNFCLDEYLDQIKFIGEFCLLVNNYYDYNEGFPTEYLWEENWKNIVDDHTKISILKQGEADSEYIGNFEKNKKNEREIMKSIKSKLTKKEYNFLLKKVR